MPSVTGNFAKGKTEKPSILGSTSSLYQIKKSENSSILDIPARAEIELYPAGYTHLSNRDDLSRQRTHRDIYEAAVVKGTEDNIAPLGTSNHTLELVHDPHNKFDKSAIHIILRAASGPLAHLDGRDLGFIPKKINKQILKNIQMCSGGYVQKVRSQVHKKYFSVKVVLQYGEKTAKRTTLERFSAILED